MSATSLTEAGVCKICNKPIVLGDIVVIELHDATVRRAYREDTEGTDHVEPIVDENTGEVLNANDIFGNYVQMDWEDEIQYHIECHQAEVVMDNEYRRSEGLVTFDEDATMCLWNRIGDDVGDAIEDAVAKQTNELAKDSRWMDFLENENAPEYWDLRLQYYKILSEAEVVLFKTMAKQAERRNQEFMEKLTDECMRHKASLEK